MASPGFGFSAGDIIAAIGLLHKAGKALKQTFGATGQYQQTILDLEVIEDCLRKVQALSPAANGTGITENIVYVGHSCHGPVARFCKKVGKFEKHLKWSSQPSQPPASPVQRGFRKIQWAVVVEDEAGKLKASIATQLSIINILLQLEHREWDIAGRSHVLQILGTATAILARVDDLQASIHHDAAQSDQISQLGPQLSNITTNVLNTSQQVERVASSIDGLIGSTMSQAHIESLQSRLHEMVVRQDQTNTRLLELSSKNDLDISNLNKVAQRLQALAEAVVCAIPRNPRSASSTVETTLPTDATARFSTLAQYAPSAEAWARFFAHIQGLCGVLCRSISAMVVLLFHVAPACRHFLRVLVAIPKSPSLLFDDNIVLTDVLGRSMSLRYEHFKYWKVLVALLENEFAGLPGAQHIAREEFAFFKSTGRTTAMIASASEWEHSVFPGNQVVMSVFTRKHVISSACPACESSRTEICNAKCWNKWFVNAQYLSKLCGIIVLADQMERQLWANVSSRHDALEIRTNTAAGDVWGRHRSRQRTHTD